MEGVKLITKEASRQRQDWTFEHDTEHGSRNLLQFAEVMISNVDDDTPLDEYKYPWIIELRRRHDHDPVRRMAIAGAFIAAAIDVALYESGVNGVYP